MQANQQTNTTTAMNTPDLNSLREQVKDLNKKPSLIPGDITLSREGVIVLPLIIFGLVAYIFRLKMKSVKGKGE